MDRAVLVIGRRWLCALAGIVFLLATQVIMFVAEIGIHIAKFHLY